MYHLAKNLYNYCKSKREREISLAIIGLPNAGKSTIKEVVGGNLTPLTVPTIGVTRPIKLKIGAYNVTIYDLGGQVRDLWKKYYHEIYGAIWVVDAADIEQLECSKEALHEDARHEMFNGKPILIFANKQDLPQALSESDLALKMGLDKLTSSSHSVRKCVALPKDGKADPALMDGVKWLVDSINKKFDQLKERVGKDIMVENEKKAIELKAREERVAKLKEDRRKAKEAEEKAAARGQNPIKAKAPKAPVSFPCTVTNPVKTELFCVEGSDGLWKCNNPAVKKSANWGWKAVCQECDDFLKAKKTAETTQDDTAPALSETAAKVETEGKESSQENNGAEEGQQ